MIDRQLSVETVLDEATGEGKGTIELNDIRYLANAFLVMKEKELPSKEVLKE